MTVTEHIRQRLHAQAGIAAPIQRRRLDFAKLEQSEWSPEFERLMRNRLLMGALRYGTLAEKRKQPGKWDLVGAIEHKVVCYKQTGNLEYLVDISNYCLLEFECGDHPLRHFRALDDHHEHCKTK